MMLRHTRDEDALADAIRANRRSTRDSQRATGTEKALTTQVAQQASVDSVFAKELAEQLQVELGPLPGQIQDALDAADAAQTTANGKSTVVRSTSAATGAGSFKLGDQWWQFSGANIVGLWLHSGSAWVEQVLTNAIIATLDAGKITTGTLSADRIGALSISSAKIAAGAIIAEKIAAGAITTAKLAADAIDGMIITGAVLRTAATGQRFQLDAFGLRAYDSTGTQTALLTPNNGGLSLMGGGLGIYSGVAYTQLTLTPTQIDFSSDGGNLHTYLNNDFLGFWKLGGDDCYVRLNGLKQRRQVAVSGGTRKLQTSVESTTSQAELSLLIESPTMQKTAGVLGAFDSNGDPVTFLNADTARVNRVTPQSGNRLQLTANVDIEATAPLTFGATSKISRASNTLKVEDGTKVRVEAPAIELAGAVSYTGDNSGQKAVTTGSPTNAILLKNSWVNREPPLTSLWNGLWLYRRDGIVYIAGCIRKGASYASEEVVGTLPAGYRPGAAWPIQATYFDVGVHILIQPNGDITTVRAGNAAQSEVLAMNGNFPAA